MTTVLLIEDDEGDALLVYEELEDGSSPVQLLRCRTLGEALARLSPDVECVLLDLGLPDAAGLEALARVRAAAPSTAVVVLTGLDDEAAGVAALEAGAQDYLVKGQVQDGLLMRAVRYAIGRRQAEDARRRLEIADLEARENARLERGLLPQPILADQAIWVASSSRPGRRSTLLGGDFFDVVQTPDGTVHALIGDVCGHGPDEAALGASLRIAWRALVLAGADGDLVLSTLQDLLEHERLFPDLFATVCTLEVEPGLRALRMRRAGHVAPLLICGASVTKLPEQPGGPPLGLTGHTRWPQTRVDLPAGWSLLLYTDGLIEGRVLGLPDRLGDERLRDLILEHVAREPGWSSTAGALLEGLVERAEELHGGPLGDDVALLLLGTRPAPPGRA